MMGSVSGILILFQQRAMHRFRQMCVGLRLQITNEINALRTLRRTAYIDIFCQVKQFFFLRHATSVKHEHVLKNSLGYSRLFRLVFYENR
jgi:hypothetical protein